MERGSVVRAAVCRVFGEPLSIEEIFLADPGPHDVRVDLVACAICHSDIHYARGEWGGELPAIYGHEASGIVSVIGNEVSDFSVGDRVVVTLIRSCGECHYCSTGDRVNCETQFDLDRSGPVTTPEGESVLAAMRTGAFAEAVVVHDSQIASVPDSVPLNEAALLACGVITGHGAVVNTSSATEASSIAVIGVGGVGLNAIQGAVSLGAREVIAVDLAPDKLRVAMEFGATATVNPAREDAARCIRDLTDGRGVSHAIVTVGDVSAVEGALGYLAPGGQLVIVGMPAAGAFASIDPSNVAALGLSIVGSKMGSSIVTRDVPALADRFVDGDLKLSELITSTYPLDEINEAIAAVERGEALRNLIVFH